MQKGTMIAVICTASFLVIGMVIGVIAMTKGVGRRTATAPAAPAASNG